MLAAALEAEVDACIARFADQRDEQGHRVVVRNGYRQSREIPTGAGAIEVRAPRINDKRIESNDPKRRRPRQPLKDLAPRVLTFSDRARRG